MKNYVERIKTEYESNNLEEMIALCNEALQEEAIEDREYIYYMLGNAYRRREDWRNALNSYQYAIDINPDSPAANARKMIIEILNYYYKDQFNQ